MGKVIDFFLSRHPPEPNDDLAVMRVFEKTSAPCRKAFGRLTLVDVASIRQTKRSEIARRGSARSGRRLDIRLGARAAYEIARKADLSSSTEIFIERGGCDATRTDFEKFDNRHLSFSSRNRSSRQCDAELCT